MRPYKISILILISPLLHRELGNISVAEWIAGKKGTAYFGITGQVLTMEHLRFMTARGANVKGKYKGQRNRPVLIWAKSRAVIKQSECITILKMQSIVMYECKLRHNACLFEEICQETYQELPLGTGRLYRHTAMGRKGKNQQEQEHMKTFMTFMSNDLFSMIDDGTILIQK